MGESGIGSKQAALAQQAKQFSRRGPAGAIRAVFEMPGEALLEGRARGHPVRQMPLAVESRLWCARHDE
jgi:hypothetical protein